MSARRIAAAAALVVCALPLLCAQAGAQTVRVRFETALGPFEVEIDPTRAPVTTTNFLKYVDGGLYDGGRVHRSARLETQAERPVKIEVIQAGIDPARRGDALPRHPDRAHERNRYPAQGRHDLHGEVRARHRDLGLLHLHRRPAVARLRRRTQPDGQGFAAFGRVVSGMDVVRAIHKAPAEGENLTPPITITGASRVVPR